MNCLEGEGYLGLLTSQLVLTHSCVFANSYVCSWSPLFDRFPWHSPTASSSPLNSANIICTEKLSCQWFIYFPRTVFLINFPSYIYAVPPTPDKPPAAVQQPGHLPESPRSPSQPMATGSSIAHWVMDKQKISLLEASFKIWLSATSDLSLCSTFASENKQKNKTRKRLLRLYHFPPWEQRRYRAKVMIFFSLVSQIMYFHIADNFHKTFLPCFLGMGKGTSHTEEGLHHHLALLQALCFMFSLYNTRIAKLVWSSLRAASLCYSCQETLIDPNVSHFMRNTKRIFFSASIIILFL